MSKFIALILIVCLATGCEAGPKRRPAKVKSKPATILVFSAKWCAPCQRYKPTLEQLKKEGYDVRIYDVDTPEGQKKMTDYGVTGLPTTVFIKDGKEVDRRVGDMTRDEVLKVLKVVGCVLYTAVKIAFILL